MEIFDSLDKIKTRGPVCLALGNFDGFHPGHIKILTRCLEISKEKGFLPAAFVFNELTLNAIRGTDEIKTLMPNKIRTDLFEELGFEYLISVPFERSIMELSPEAFFDAITDSALVGHFVCGFNYTFGYKARGNTRLLKELSEKKGTGLDIIDGVAVNGVTVSSTLLRRLLDEGRVEEFEYYCGSPFTVYGIALSQEKGSLAADSSQQMPADGSYRVFIEGDNICASADADVYTSENGIRHISSDALPENGSYFRKDRFRIEFQRRLTVI